MFYLTNQENFKTIEPQFAVSLMKNAQRSSIKLRDNRITNLCGASKAYLLIHPIIQPIQYIRLYTIPSLEISSHHYITSHHPR